MPRVVIHRLVGLLRVILHCEECRLLGRPSRYEAAVQHAREAGNRIHGIWPNQSKRSRSHPTGLDIAVAQQLHDDRHRCPGIRPYLAQGLYRFASVPNILVLDDAYRFDESWDRNLRVRAKTSEQISCTSAY